MKTCKLSELHKAVSSVLTITKRTVQGWAKKGLVPAVNVGNQYHIRLEMLEESLIKNIKIDPALAVDIMSRL